VGTQVSLGIAAVAVCGLVLVIARWRVSRRHDPAARLGGYQLLELLGQGGMGEVWRAEHKSLIRPAAIKLLRGELLASLPARDLDELQQRFRREVQITATLSSPHTVAIFDYGHTPDRALYYVMELLHGVDLEYLVATYGPQPAERVVYLLRQVCESLAEAHHRNLIHRDIKPANIYICAVGMKVDFAKVLDFGLVRDLEVDHRLTVQGTTPGTPAYLAPESIEDKLEPRSDLYSLGCVAYWLLTGRLVFEADTRIAMIAAHQSQQPIAPSRCSELPIPAELDAIVLALLAKNPADRPGAAELARQLAAVPLATAWTDDRADAWWRAHLPDKLAASRYE
jgi:eukaryotic-like serine/threonine-protein kinase